MHALPLVAGILLAGQDVYIEEIPGPPVRLRPAVSVTGRMTFLSGSLSDGGVDYSDNFDPGLGLSAEFDLLYGIPHGWWIGGYISAGFDHFNGERFTDPFGTSVDPDDLDILTGFVGLKSQLHLDPLSLVEGRIGVGVVRYEEVEAEILDLGVLRTNQEFFEQTTRPAFEMAGNIQFGTPKVTLNLGFGFRFMDGPDEGDDAEFLLDTEPVWAFMMEIGVTFRF